MRHEVIVVGAGVAGLSAARELRKLGRDVIVVEARDRLGGRTWNSDIAGATVETLRALLGEVLDPIATTTTDWSNDPYSDGAYSFIPLNSSGADIEILVDPFGQSLVLAGEHTVARYYGTVHAAFLSGRRAARQIAGSR